MGTGLTTQVLKQITAQPRALDWLGANQVGDASWPSGHATAAMTLALCAILVSPARLRPAAALLGGAFTVAVSYSILALSWHFPSDVVGAYLVAATWTLVAVAALEAVGARRSGARAEPDRASWSRPRRAACGVGRRRGAGPTGEPR